MNYTHNIIRKHCSNHIMIDIVWTMRFFLIAIRRMLGNECITFIYRLKYLELQGECGDTNSDAFQNPYPRYSKWPTFSTKWASTTYLLGEASQTINATTMLVPDLREQSAGSDNICEAKKRIFY